ncbi:monovalent cation/H(+) antiporter subunit G [Lipingzhangella sp. LS1_29]|uniref:Monovalent cation/H(+) antiporter subunit G n=1 Tax=Lipingzhangella rawalii TaxID=2055835 RepID=A0ABU2H3K2_9ACTN|nr:monovalent cation/H(+) antiporter subunit G [Lipingzhangella rawalii]MDS1269878.1 monovalent cation/H(+) antiporter subunit G [Lipingzhangella rawalii]
MAELVEAVALGCLLAGAALSLVAGVGLLRFPDLLTRLHAATKPQVLGVLLILAGIELRTFPEINAGILLLVAFFQVLTVPVAAHLVARTAYRTGRGRASNLTRDDLGWGERERGSG